MSTIQETTNEETISRGWRLDRERSSVEFRVKLLWGLATVTGHFEDYYGRLDLSADPAIELTIDAASLQTGNSKRDDHLRGDDFFDVENHPRLRFLSDGVELRGDTLKVRGRLSARGRCIPLELDAEIREIDGELVLEATATARHRELGMTWSPLGTISPRSELSVKAHLVPDPGATA
jgi:polyisoprenoid-binding protein YceI